MSVIDAFTIEMLVAFGMVAVFAGGIYLYTIDHARRVFTKLDREREQQKSPQLAP